MVLRGSLSRLLFTIIALAVLSPTSGWALFVDWFKKDLDRVPASAELRRQEDEARSLLNRAIELEGRGRNGRALDTHQSVVRKYPLTTAAAMSQFKVGELYRKDAKFTKAFDAFQTFIDGYKGSSAFTEAIRAQYEIAQAGQRGDFKDRIFAMVPVKVQSSELLEWYGKIIANAPYSEHAPLSQFAIAEIYQEQEKTAMAINAYQAFVDNYPGHPQSAEAQFRIGSIGRAAIAEGSQDRGNIREARGAMEDVLVRYQDSERAAEARAALTEFDLLETEKQYNIGRFYEKQKKYRSAAIYYKRVAANPASPHSADAQARLEGMIAKAPEAAITTTPAPAGGASGTVASATAPARPALLKARPTYNGPPAPDLAALNTRPKMRTNPSAVPIVPLPDPDPNPPLETPLPPPPDPEPSTEVGVTLPPETEDPPPLPPEPEDDFLLPPPPAPDPEPSPAPSGS